MAKLMLEFRCLCLFVTDPDSKAVHVLMPTMAGHEGHAGHQHVVRMLHRTFKNKEMDEGTGKKTVGIPMEGWALLLGPENGSANLDLDHKVAAGGKKAELPDLTTITNDKKVDRALVGPMPGHRVAARVTLRSGKLHDLDSEADWDIDGKPYALAHRVVWEMDVDPALPLEWKGLNGKSDNNAKPLESLIKLAPESNLSYTLTISHVTEKALEQDGATLDPAVMREHFRAFYPLLGENAPAAGLLPSIKGKGIGKVNCAGSRAQISS
jgi:hypothetical protein